MTVPEIQQVLPREGQVSLEQVSRLVAIAPTRFGIPDICAVRSILVQRQDGRWVNHCTVLRLGTSLSGSSDSVRDIHVGGARLIGRDLSAKSIVDTSQLVDVLTSWRIALPHGFLKRLETTPYGPAVEERPWDFQESANLYHNPSGNLWGKAPCWVIDVQDRQGNNRGFAAPRGPFRHVESDVFAPDLGTLAKNWCSDPTWREGGAVQDAYRVVIPDHRAYIDNITRDGPEIRIGVTGDRTSSLKCSITVWDRDGNDKAETKDVAGGQVRFMLSDSSHSLEVYVFDESDAWCDRSPRTELERLPQDREKESDHVNRRPGRSRPVTQPQRSPGDSRANPPSKARTFGERWQSLGQLGEGGQAVTYKVRDIKSPEKGFYVLKRLKNPSRLPRFRREIEAALSLEHPNIIRIYASNLETEPYYFVSEHCPPGSLAEAAEATPFWKDDPVKALMLFEKICSGVAYAHAGGVIHRDLKPENILLRDINGPPVIADFGICFLQQEKADRFTETTEAVGPRWFMAPELEDGRLEAVSPKADCYSLGKLLYWLVSGGRVFSREKHRQADWDLKGQDSDTITGWRSILLEHVNQILDLSVVADPNERREADNLMVLARKAARLVADQRYPLAAGLRHPCSYCGKGYYALRVEGSPTQVSNFGFSPAAGADWRVSHARTAGMSKPSDVILPATILTGGTDRRLD